MNTLCQTAQQGKLSFACMEDTLQNISYLWNDMDLFECRFYKLNYRLLSFLGLWPYQKSRLRRICMMNIIITSFSLTQFIKLFTCNGDFSIIAEIIPILVTCLNVGIKYHTYNIGIPNIKALMGNMIADWKTWKDKQEETKIMEKFAKLARMYTLIYAICIYTFMYLYIFSSLLTPIMDVIMPLNESRHMKLPFKSEYFVNQEKHFYLLYIHIIITVPITVTVIIAVDTIFMVFSCHISGLFAIVAFRLEHYLKENVTLHEMSAREKTECFKHVTLSIKTHKRAIEFANSIESLFSYPLLVQCGFNVVCLSISLYQIVALFDKWAEGYKFVSFVCGQLFHLFCASYAGQLLIDYSSDVYLKAYSGSWYEIPVKVQKLLILVMRRSLEPCRLSAGKLFIFCMESFATILQTSTSYFMVLSSIQ